MLQRMMLDTWLTRVTAWAEGADIGCGSVSHFNGMLLQENTKTRKKSKPGDKGRHENKKKQEACTSDKEAARIGRLVTTLVAERQPSAAKRARSTYATGSSSSASSGLVAGGLPAPPPAPPVLGPRPPLAPPPARLRAAASTEPRPRVGRDGRGFSGLFRIQNSLQAGLSNSYSVRRMSNLLFRAGICVECRRHACPPCRPPARVHRPPARRGVVRLTALSRAPIYTQEQDTQPHEAAEPDEPERAAPVVSVGASRLSIGDWHVAYGSGLDGPVIASLEVLAEHDPQAKSRTITEGQTIDIDNRQSTIAQVDTRPVRV